MQLEINVERPDISSALLELMAMLSSFAYFKKYIYDFSASILQLLKESKNIFLWSRCIILLHS